MAAPLLHLWPHAPPPLVLLGIGAAGALLVIAACLLRPSSKERAHARAPLPFDVEGGGTAAVLPQAVVEAAANGDVGMLRAWIGDPRCVIDACSAADGSTALHAACKAGHVNIVRLLLEASADVLAVDADLRTPLHLVAAAGHGICVKALLDAGSDPEGHDGEGNTPLQLAERARHMGCLRMMRLFQERKTATNETRVHRRAK